MRWFVTGTDTEVGKSVVTACLAAHARSLGTVAALKPVASGVSAGSPGEDAALLGIAAGHPPRSFATFEAALSPHRAAALEGRQVDPEALLAWIEGFEADTVLVEGVGGWRVPLAPGFEVADLATRLGDPVVVVAADELGVLNHTLLTVESVRARGLEVAGVVLNRFSAQRRLASNPDDLRELLDVPVALLGPVEDSGRARAGAQIWAELRIEAGSSSAR